jgi:hypothetical protein
MWLANSVPVVTAQSTGMKAFFDRMLQAWMARAINSLPVPLGPRISTLDWCTATSSIDRRTCSAHGEIPTIRWMASFPGEVLATVSMGMSDIVESRAKGNGIPVAA